MERTEKTEHKYRQKREEKKEVFMYEIARVHSQCQEAGAKVRRIQTFQNRYSPAMLGCLSFMAYSVTKHSHSYIIVCSLEQPLLCCALGHRM